MCYTFDRFKLKIGLDISDDIRRAKIMRQELGPDRTLVRDVTSLLLQYDVIANMYDVIASIFR